MHQLKRPAASHVVLCTFVVALAVLLSCRPVVHAQTSAPGPLDPLTADEIRLATQVLRTSGKITAETRFPIVMLREPAKDLVLHYQPGQPVPREAFVMLYERESNRTFEAIVDVAGRRLVSWKQMQNVQPPLMSDDAEVADGIVRADPQWRAAMKRHGVTDLRTVSIESWAAGYFGEKQANGARLAKCLFYLRDGVRNYYARPIPGVLAFVNLNTNKIVELVDQDSGPIPQGTAEFEHIPAAQRRPQLKPLIPLQPQGGNFIAHGNDVEWQKWHFHLGLNPREGLVLHNISYDDGGSRRSILYRASLSEMVVPYGDPDPLWYFRNAFDPGELGMGKTAVNLQAGRDYPVNGTCFPQTLTTEQGEPYELRCGVAVFERDGGLLWKYASATRRSRQLVVSFISWLGNYEYQFNWIFGQDGSLEMQALLTGIMATKGVVATDDRHEPGHQHYGHLVMPGVEAVHHQHFFVFRLDFDVDGNAGNTVVEMNTQSAPAGPRNPYGNAFLMTETPLRTEHEAQRMLDLATSRKWKVINPHHNNSLGESSGYALIPGENAIPYAAPGSFIRRRAGFLNAHLWVTPYQRDEIYAAGDYPNQSHGGEGLSKWTEANRKIEDTDVVVWYTLGVTHIPRQEDWPVMPVQEAGFKLIPMGFFSQNPALDLP